MKNQREFAVEFVKKELASIEKSFIQFKQIYDYFQDEGANQQKEFEAYL